MLKALGYRLLIKPDEVETSHEVKGTDIKIAIAVDEKLYKATMSVGTIVDIGPLAWIDYNKNSMLKKPWAEIGDKILYSRYGGKLIQDPETKEEFVILDDGDVLCKMVDKEQKQDE
jgi:co-chaperonin GroES (HSP10)